MNEDSKQFCIVNQDGYYMETVTCFKDPKDPSRYSIPGDAIDIESPDIDMLADMRKAKLSEDGVHWVYEEPEKQVTHSHHEETSHHPHPHPHEEQEPPHLKDDPMMFVRMCRDMRLFKSDIEVLKCVEDGKSVSKELKKYREELRELPTNIESGFIPKPKHNLNANYEIGRHNPEEFIIFEHWPVYKK